MADFVIREADGWEELDEFEAVAREHQVIDELWAAVGSGDRAASGEILRDMGFIEEDEMMIGFKMIAVPDDIHGETLRAWVKVK